VKRPAQRMRTYAEEYVARKEASDVRRFMAIGFVVALVLLSAEALVLYAAAHPGFVPISGPSAQDVGLRGSASSTTGVSVTATATAGPALVTLTTLPATPTISAPATPRSDFVSRVIARTYQSRAESFNGSRSAVATARLLVLKNLLPTPYHQPRPAVSAHLV
jgi:hypothetical protein